MSFINLFNHKKSKYKGEGIYLLEDYRIDSQSAYDGVSTIYYRVYDDSDNLVGKLDLRLTIDGFMYYYGHVGYNIIEKYRGNNYAYRACKVLFDIAKNEFNMKELIITCSPENIPSYKTLCKLGGEIIDFVDVPKDHELYMLGEKKKYIFRYKL